MEKDNIKELLKCKRCGEKRNLLTTGYCEICNDEFCDELAGRV